MLNTLRGVIEVSGDKADLNNYNVYIIFLLLPYRQFYVCIVVNIEGPTDHSCVTEWQGRHIP